MRVHSVRRQAHPQLPRHWLVLWQPQLDHNEAVGVEPDGEAAQRAHGRDRVRVSLARLPRAAQHDDVLGRPHGDACKVVHLGSGWGRGEGLGLGSGLGLDPNHNRAIPIA